MLDLLRSLLVRGLIFRRKIDSDFFLVAATGLKLECAFDDARTFSHLDKPTNSIIKE